MVPTAIPEIAEQFGVSISSVVHFRRLHRETGSVSPTKFGGYKGYALAAHEELVRELVAEQSDLTLAELKPILATEKVTVGQSSISRFLHHLNLRFKKSLRAAEQDRPDVAAARKALQKSSQGLIRSGWFLSMKPASPRRLAGITPPYGLRDLVRGQLGLATEALAVRHGAPTPVVGSGLDEIALELSQPAQDRHHQPAMRCCGVDPSVGQRLKAGALPRNGVERVEYDLRKAGLRW
jgi:transposase